MAFQVVYPGVWLDKVRILLSKATNVDLKNELQAALTGLHDKMSQSPMESGEPIYKLKHVKLTVYVMVYRYVSAKYAVDEDKKIVFLLRFALATGHPYPPEFEEILNPKTL